MNERLSNLAEAGVAIWLDDLSRERIDSGNLDDLIANRGVVGVTTNPSIFAKALSQGGRYQSQLAELQKRKVDLDQATFELTTSDVRQACDILRPVFNASNGSDGWVSIEVDPGLAYQTDKTIAVAKELAAFVDRPNVFIKIPATEEGLPAIAACIAAGININITLIFSLERYRGVMDAYLYGLEQAQAEGRDLNAIHSVASFFVSRVDSEVDKRLPENSPLRGHVGIANARLAYQAYEQVFAGQRFASLAANGANRQGPLWASTGVKNPDYPDTMYVSELIAENVVNTMPEDTLEAFADHGEVKNGTASSNYDESAQILADLATAGISYDDVVGKLETEGVDKFIDAWSQLQSTIAAEMNRS